MVTKTKTAAKSKPDSVAEHTGDLPVPQAAEQERRAVGRDGGAVLLQVPVGRLVPTADNPRTVVADEEFRALVESVRAEGVRIPLHARPMPAALYQAAFRRHWPDVCSHYDAEVNKNEFYTGCMLDLRAGARRHAAAIEAGLQTVPVIVEALDDRQAAMLTVVENKDRADLTPLEEAASIELLLKRGWEPGEVAAQLGRTAGWVARRAHLLKLSALWRRAVQSRYHWAQQWPLDRLEVIARLPETVQDEVYVELDRGAGNPGRVDDIEQDEALDESLSRKPVDDGDVDYISKRAIPSARSLARWVAEEYLQTLAGAPWSLDDASLVVEAGSCTACEKRTGKQPLLFDNLQAKEAESSDRGKGKGKAKAAAAASVERCLDRKCYERKREAFVRLRVQETKAEYGAAYVVGAAYGERIPKAVRRVADGVASATFPNERKKEGDRGAVPAVVLSGPEIGQVQWVKKPAEKQQAPTAKGGPRDSPAVKAAKERRRLFIELVRDGILSRWCGPARKKHKGADQDRSGWMSTGEIVKLLAASEACWNSGAKRPTWGLLLDKAFNGKEPDAEELRLAMRGAVGLMADLPDIWGGEHDEKLARILGRELMEAEELAKIEATVQKKFPGPKEAAETGKPKAAGKAKPAKKSGKTRKVKCLDCGKALTGDDPDPVDGRPRCAACAGDDAEWVTCPGCGEQLGRDDAMRGNGGKLHCPECAECGERA